MPLFLPQLTRREFLKRAVCAGAGMALAPRLLAASLEKPSDSNTFAFFSDPHIAADPAEQHLGVNMSRNLAACTSALAEWPVRPAGIFVNGDLAYLRGEPRDYAGFATLIEPLRAIAPVHLTLGNHDQRDHFWAAFPAEAADESGVFHRQTGIIVSDHANWFLLDTLAATDHAPGKLGQAQLDWLAKELDARPDKPAIIVLHHNPQFIPVITTGLSDTRALMAVIAPRRQVKLTIFGHTHDWHLARDQSGIHLLNLPPTAYVFIAGRPSGWVQATLAGDGAKFELRALDQKHPEHGQVHDFKWRDA
jgi:Icc protein